MRVIRRSLQVLALVGTLFVGIIALGLIVSQTPWFRDWMRRYIVRESKQYLNGELSIGSIGGNLLFGVQVNDIAVNMSGEQVVAARNLEVDYSIFEIISKGVVLNEIKLAQPYVRLERDGGGWNLASLVKEQAQEAEREGPGTPLSLQSIQIVDGRVDIADAVGTSGYNLPQRIEKLNLTASYEYEPVHYSVVVDRASFQTSSPDLTLSELTGKVAVRDDNVYIENLALRTSESAIEADGVIENYLATPVVKVTTRGTVSLPEIGRIVPAAAEYGLHPQFTIRAAGPAEALQLALDVDTRAGGVEGNITVDVDGPDLGARGSLNVRNLNLAPLLKDPEQASDITGRADLDLRLAGTPESAPAIDRLTGTFRVSAPALAAAGYRARDVQISGTLKDARVEIDGRASAYGGSATAKGMIVPPAAGRALAFDIRGAAEDVDLSGLPESTGAPAIDTNLSIAEYHISGEGKTIAGTARLNESTIEGATVAQGTSAEFRVEPKRISYTASGRVSRLNLARVGRALEVEALDKPAYDGVVNGEFDVRGSMPARDGAKGDDSRLGAMELTASGTLRDSSLMGGSVPSMKYEATLSQGQLSVTADGQFRGFNPGTLAEREQLKGTVNGTVNLSARVANIAEPVTPDAIAAEGAISLEDSEVGGLKIDGATVKGRYADEVGEIEQLNVSGPDLRVEAAGRLALNRTGSSDLRYHVEAIDLAALSSLAGAPATAASDPEAAPEGGSEPEPAAGAAGSATLDGRITGNAASLLTTGKLDGSNVGYGGNKALDLNSTYAVTIPDLTFAKAQVEAKTLATFVEAGGLKINTLAADTTYADNRVSFTTHIKEERRELQASGDVVLHPDHREVHLPELAVRTQGIEWRTAPEPPSTAAEAKGLKHVPTVKYGGDRLELENIRLVSGEQYLEVEGTLALKGEEPAGQITVEAGSVDLTQLETLMLTDRGLAGTLSADATITGTAVAPMVDGHVEIRNGAFQSYKYERLTADVDYSGTRIGVDARLQQSPTEAITVKGTMPMSLFQASPGGHIPETADDRVDLHVESTALDLGVIQGFTTQVTNVTGTLQADLRVTGSGQDPHVNGYIDIDEGAFGVPAVGISYTGLDTRIELAEDTVRLEKFAILDEEGRALNVSGEIAVHAKQVGAVNVSVQSENFELIDNELGDIGVGTNISITGELRRPVIKGQVRLATGRLEVDELLQLFYDPYSLEELPAVVSAERTVEGSGSAEEATRQALRRAGTTAAVPGTKAEAEEGESPASEGAFAPVELDLRLVIPDNLVLRGDNLRPGGPTGASLGDMNITVGGDLQVVKPSGGELRVLGTVQTVRGTYEFQGRRFDLARGGTLRFMGEPEPNPALDITATRVIPNTGVEAQVRIQGTAKAPQLSLTSTPPLEESDILALIVFNRPVNELGSGERASLAATAGGIATGFIAAPLGESIGRALDLDLFEITTTTEEGELGAGLTVGQQIGDRAYFKLRQQFGDRSITEFLLEYQLADFFRVQMTAAPETSGSANRIGQRRIERAGIDFIFFFSY